MPVLEGCMCMLLVGFRPWDVSFEVFTSRRFAPLPFRVRRRSVTCLGARGLAMFSPVFDLSHVPVVLVDGIAVGE